MKVRQQVLGGVEVKKKIWALGVLIFAGLSGCGFGEIEVSQEEEVIPLPESEEIVSETEEYDIEISENLYDFQFALNGKVWSLPSPLREWEADGWESSETQDTELEAESYTTEGEILQKGDDLVTVFMVNPESEKKPLKDCYVGKAELQWEQEGQVIQLPGDITMGKSVLNDVLDAYGTPQDQYEEKEEIYVTYEYGMYKEADFIFDLENETLQRAVLVNYREPEDESETVSEEVPREVSEYESPEDFSENPLDFVVSYGEDFYKIPAPVSSFEENGWKINEEGSDTSVKAGRHGYVTLEKDGQVLYAVVKNYAESKIPVKNCMVTNVSGDFDVTKMPIAVGNRIALGMGEEDMKIRLGGSTYESEEEETGTSYYLYADETKKNYIRIFVDRDLKLVREIEVSNSPEQLLEENEGEEGENTENADSSALIGESFR